MVEGPQAMRWAHYFPFVVLYKQVLTQLATPAMKQSKYWTTS